VLSAIEALPEDFCDVADTVTINYPWGSLLSAMTTPDTTILAKIARMAKADAEIRILLNWSVFENEGYCERLGLPRLTLADVEARLVPKYHEAGLTIVKHGLEGTGPTTTTWGKKLVKGSNRAVLSIVCRRS
jgi:16S rRNA (adenine(1408)-N(1))-methyltransferase